MLTLAEAARSLGLAPSTLRHQIRLGKFAAHRMGRDWFCTPQEVERYRVENKRAAA
jgi:excisionase family DNA binding protein